MVLASFDAVQRRVRNPYLLGKIRIRQARPRLPQEFRKLAIQVSLHPATLSKWPSRMRDDVRLQSNRPLLLSPPRDKNVVRNPEPAFGFVTIETINDY